MSEKFKVEEIDKVFAPIFDAALKHAGIQIVNHIQAAKGILGKCVEQPEPIKEEINEQEDND